MAYIGKQPLVGNYQVLDAIVATTTDTYALTKDTVAVFPQTPSNCIVSLNGVIQAPVSSYTISGSNIVFDSALTGSDSIDFITVLGDVLSIGTPTDGTVTTAKLVDSSVTTAKLNDGSVSLAKLTATGTKDATTFLRGDNTFASAGITEADMFRLTASHTGDADITSNLERVDSSGFSKIGTGMSQSSGIFTFASTGIYQILVQANISFTSQADNVATVTTSITLDNSSYTNVAHAISGNGNQTGSTGVTCYSQYFLDVTDTSNVKVKFTTTSFQGTLEGDTDINRTCFSFIRLGDT